MPAIEVQVRCAEGLHARPAFLLVRTATELDAEIRVARADDPSAVPADARSIIAVLALGIRSGDRVRVEADGPDAAVALEAVAALLEDETPASAASTGVS
ncbi:MAG: HPr family phosphocarrier protein [Chloroflexota bacterium]